MTDQPIHQIEMNIDPEMITGRFADIAGVSHNEFGFTLDFGVMDQTKVDENGNSITPAYIVARLKVPTGVVFQIARAIADNVSRYEDNFGPITPRSEMDLSWAEGQGEEDEDDDHSDDNSDDPEQDG